MVSRLAVVAFLLLALPVGTGVPAAGAAANTSTVAPADPTPHGIETIYNSSRITHTGGGAGVDVAVIDTGVDRDHPDLRRRLVACRDYTGGGVRRGTCEDESGHGTHVAGIVLADGGPNGTGLYGVAPDADLLAFKVCAGGGCRVEAVERAIRDAVDTGAEVIVISLGGANDAGIHDAMAYARRRGTLVVASAGNEGPDLNTTEYPGADPLAVAVGAVERSGGPAIVPANYRVPDFSARGPDVANFSERPGVLEVTAPGVSVRSTWLDGGYRVRSGTSMAAPHVAGLAAKLWPANGGTAADDAVRRILRERAARFDVQRGKHAAPGYDPAAGFGVPQVIGPTARIVAAPAPAIVGEPAELRANASAPDSEIVRYEWDVGADGTVDATGERATYTFGRPGENRVVLRAVAADGTRAVVRVTVGATERPTATFGYGPRPPTPGATVTFDAANATDPDGRIARYEWDVGADGTVDARGVNASWSFETPGPHRVRLRVTDDDNATATVVREVRVNAPPRAGVGYDPRVPLAGTAVTVRASGATDPDGEIVRYEWDVGADGTIDATGERATVQFPDVGEVPLRLRVTDDDGTTADATRRVLVNDRPTVRIEGQRNVTAREPVVLNATVENAVGTTRMTWFFEGGNASGPTLNRTFAPGTHRVRVRVTDEYGASANATVEVRVEGGIFYRTTPGFGAPAAVFAVALLLVSRRRG